MKKIIPSILCVITLCFIILSSYIFLENHFQELRPKQIHEFLKDDSIVEKVYNYMDQF